MTSVDPVPAALKDQSYAVVRGLFDLETAARLQQICERVLAQWRSAPRHDNPPVGPQANYMRHLNDPEYHRDHPDDLAFLLNALGAPQLISAIAEALDEEFFFLFPVSTSTPQAKARTASGTRTKSVTRPISPKTPRPVPGCRYRSP